MLTATHSSKSAYCQFRYDKQFFARYRMEIVDTSPPSSDDSGHLGVPSITGQLLAKVGNFLPSPSCKPSLKNEQSLLSVFKHRTVEKTVERSDILIIDETTSQSQSRLLDGDNGSVESKVIVRLHCKQGANSPAFSVNDLLYSRSGQNSSFALDGFHTYDTHYPRQ
jgi:cell cycle checkpoint control protein RAD9A